jgi:hypothetical protein
LLLALLAGLCSWLLLARLRLRPCFAFAAGLLARLFLGTLLLLLLLLTTGLLLARLRLLTGLLRGLLTLAGLALLRVSLLLFLSALLPLALSLLLSALLRRSLPLFLRALLLLALALLLSALLRLVLLLAGSLLILLTLLLVLSLLLGRLAHFVGGIPHRALQFLHALTRAFLGLTLTVFFGAAFGFTARGLGFNTLPAEFAFDLAWIGAGVALLRLIRLRLSLGLPGSARGGIDAGGLLIWRGAFGQLLTGLLLVGLAPGGLTHCLGQILEFLGRATALLGVPGLLPFHDIAGDLRGGLEIAAADRFGHLRELAGFGLIGRAGGASPSRLGGRGDAIAHQVAGALLGAGAFFERIAELGELPGGAGRGLRRVDTACFEFPLDLLERFEFTRSGRIVCKLILLEDALRRGLSDPDLLARGGPLRRCSLRPSATGAINGRDEDGGGNCRDDQHRRGEPRPLGADRNHPAYLNTRGGALSLFDGPVGEGARFCPW